MTIENLPTYSPFDAAPNTRTHLRPEIRESRYKLAMHKPEIKPYLEPSGFELSDRSEARLKGVNPYLADVVRRAIKISKIDFGVAVGVRSKAAQAKMVKQGRSLTHESKHLTGHAVDLYGWVDGAADWSWDAAYRIATAMALAELQKGLAEGAHGRGWITWGGIWDTRLVVAIDGNEGVADPLETLVKATAAYRKRASKRIFFDGVHYEISSDLK